MDFLVVAEEEIGKAFLWKLEAFGVQVPQPVIRSHKAKRFTKVVIFDPMDLLLFASYVSRALRLEIRPPGGA